MVFISCSADPSPSLEGFWVAQVQKTDENQYQPYAWAIHFEENGKFQAGTLYDFPRQSGEWSIRGDSLAYGEFVMPLPKLDDINNKMQFGTRLPVFYFKPRAVNLNINTNSIQKLLENTSWKQGTQHFYFADNGSFFIQPDPIPEESSQYCWEIASQFGSTFLIKKGSKYGCDQYSHFPEQILSFDDNKMVTLKWDNGEMTEFEYLKMDTPVVIEPDDRFQTCNPFYTHRINSYRYSIPSKYVGGLHSLKEKLLSQDLPRMGGFTGLISVQFVINCVGKAGRHELKSMDSNYQMVPLDEGRKEKFISAVKTLQDWEPLRYDGMRMDSSKTLHIRYSDGKISEIFT